MRKTGAWVFILYTVAGLIFSQDVASQPDTGQPFIKMKAIPETFEQLPFSAIKPGGWLKKKLKKALEVLQATSIALYLP